MARLVAATGHGIDLRFGENLVGSEAGIHVSVMPELGLDPRHYCIRTTSDGCEIVDLRSSTGTFVNGEAVTGIRALRHGDVIQAGQLSLMLEDERSREKRELTAPPVQVATGPTGGGAGESVPPAPAGAEDVRSDSGNERKWMMPAVAALGALFVAGGGMAMWASGVFSGDRGGGGEAERSRFTALSPEQEPAPESASRELESGPAEADEQDRQTIAMRDARHLASVYAAAMAAGAEPPPKDAALEDVVALLTTEPGLTGSGGLSGTNFLVSGMDEERRKGAMPFLEWKHGELIASGNPRPPEARGELETEREIPAPEDPEPESRPGETTDSGGPGPKPSMEFDKAPRALPVGKE